MTLLVWHSFPILSTCLCLYITSKFFICIIYLGQSLSFNWGIQVIYTWFTSLIWLDLNQPPIWLLFVLHVLRFLLSLFLPSSGYPGYFLWVHFISFVNLHVCLFANNSYSLFCYLRDALGFIVYMFNLPQFICRW